MRDFLSFTEIVSSSPLCHELLGKFLDFLKCEIVWKTKNPIAADNLLFSELQLCKIENSSDTRKRHIISP